MWKIVESIDLLIIAHLAEIKPGQKVLDIATGIGEPAVTAAEVVGDSSITTNGDKSCLGYRYFTANVGNCKDLYF